MGLLDNEPLICFGRGFCCNLKSCSRQGWMHFCLAMCQAVRFLLQSLGCRFVVDMLEAEGLDCDSHDIVHLSVGLQEVQILVSNMLE